MDGGSSFQRLKKTLRENGAFFVTLILVEFFATQKGNGENPLPEFP
jgi:hypothetical protein